MQIRYVVLLAIFTILCQSADAGAWSLGEVETPDAGWVLDDSGGKVFPIGVWGIPGYAFTRDSRPEPAGNDSVYLAATEPFNAVVMQAGYQKSYMFGHGTLFLAGAMTYRWSLSGRGYTGDIPLTVNPEEESLTSIPFDRMHRIRENVDRLGPYIRDQVVTFVDTCYTGEDFVHFIMDEPDTGGRGWFWPPEVIGAYHDRIREVTPGRLSFIDFGGTASGNRYFYEQTFGRMFRTGTNPGNGECNPAHMNTYCYAFDGTPLYDNKRWFFRREWVRKSPATMAYAFYENTYRTARAYRESSDIAGVNSYLPFRDFPETAGEVVDAIRDACGPAKPVWLFFDGEGVSRTSDLSYNQYARLVTCQVYTAIIHGATGALFYAASMTPEQQERYWPLVCDLARTLRARMDVITSTETGHGWDTSYHRPGYDHIHYSIRQSDNHGGVLIVSNTDRDNAHRIEVPGFPPMELGPLEVAVMSEDGTRL